MSIGFFFSGIFWGVLLILFGISLLIKVIFGIDIPVAKTFIALMLIYAGIAMISGTLGFKSKGETIIFDTATIRPDKPYAAYSVVMAKGIFDFTHLTLDGQSMSIEICTTFGESFIKLNPTIPTTIVVSAAFADAKLPDHTRISFGTYHYSTDRDQSQPRLEIRAHVVFGSLKITNA